MPEPARVEKNTNNNIITKITIKIKIHENKNYNNHYYTFYN